MFYYRHFFSVTMTISQWLSLNVYISSGYTVEEMAGQTWPVYDIHASIVYILHFIYIFTANQVHLYTCVFGSLTTLNNIKTLSFYAQIIS